MKLILITLISLSGFAAMAAGQGPTFEPGPVIQLEQVASEVVDVLLLARPSDLKTFIRSGNVTKEVSRQRLQPGVTFYQFVRQQCSLGGITGGVCLGGAVLQVVVTEKQTGSMKVIAAKSSIQLIK